jgi:hypothetical protein
MTVLTIIVTIAVAAIFLAAAWVKFSGEPHAMRTRDRLGIRPDRYRLIGVVEVAGAVGALAGLVLPGLGIAALAGLVVVALGACAAQVKLRNSPGEARPAAIALVLSAGALALQAATG